MDALEIDEILRSSLGFEVAHSERLAGGCVGEVLAWTSTTGEKLVGKLDPARSSGLEVEARMLRDLAAAKAPAPRVRLGRADLLVMDFIEGRTGARGQAEEHLADVLADLHAAPLADPRFGYDYDTRIGGLVQPNPRTTHWLPFFAEHRLVHMAREARDVGRLAKETARAVDRLASRLDEWLDEPSRGALLHGDLWSGNVLSQGSRVTALIDPALHIGHPEVELAFTALFSSFGDRFRARYRDRTGGPNAAFWRERCELYNLYPLLVHARLFGGSYADDVARTVARFG